MMNKVAARGLSVTVRNPVKTTKKANFPQNPAVMAPERQRDFRANAAVFERNLAQKHSDSNFPFFRNKVVKN